MKKNVKLKDGHVVLIREMTQNDLYKSFEFFQKLPAEDKKYLRVDVSDFEMVEHRIKMMDYMEVKRLIALDGDDIIADGAFEREGHGWKRDIGELRLIIAKDYQRRGLGMIMANEMFQLALKEGVNELVVKMMKPQKAAQRIFTKLGFSHDATLTNHVKDQGGHHQDLIIMRCGVKEMWEELEDYFFEKDHRHAVTHMH
jgi:RimJ/RimL family protein N-acetyltransferase